MGNSPTGDAHTVSVKCDSCARLGLYSIANMRREHPFVSVHGRARMCASDVCAAPPRTRERVTNPRLKIMRLRSYLRSSIATGKPCTRDRESYSECMHAVARAFLQHPTHTREDRSIIPSWNARVHVQQEYSASERKGNNKLTKPKEKTLHSHQTTAHHTA
jgi:hypothetical protein